MIRYQVGSSHDDFDRGEYYRTRRGRNCRTPQQCRRHQCRWWKLANASTDNTIGGTTAADRNVISGHAPNDIAIFIQDGSNGNKVFGNYIGTNAAGTAAIPNGFGIEIFNATGNVIGAVGSGRNVISGNDDDGISLNGIGAPGNNQIVGNYIGLQPDGTTPLGNGGDGIFIGNPGVELTIIGPGNVISANESDGIQLDDAANNSKIIGNIIGLDAGGTINLGNDQSGIQVGVNSGAAENNTIGGTTAGDRNVISGNGDNGILIEQNAANTQILGNYVGTNAAGTAAVPNIPNGILFDGNVDMGNNVGSSTPGSGNLISGNQQAGIRFSGSIDIGSFGQAQLDRARCRWNNCLDERHSKRVARNPCLGSSDKSDNRTL